MAFRPRSTPRTAVWGWVKAAVVARVAVALGAVMIVNLGAMAPGGVSASAGTLPAGRTVAYQPPVNGPVVDPFRLPAQQWEPGNRGVDYATGPADVVATAAPGVVVFAGQVGGDLHVTVAHDDGLRTTYSFLVSVAVAQGAVLDAGDVVGVSDGRFHFGVRDPHGAYLDPLSLFVATVVRLVPGGDDGAVVVVGSSQASLWALVSDLVGRGVSVGAPPGVPVLPFPVDVGSTMVHYAHHFGSQAALREMAVAVAGELAGQGECTPAEQSPPPPVERRIMVTVAGFGSTSDPMGIDGVDTETLGYDPSDVMRFSYAGGRVPGPSDGPPSPFDDLEASTYGTEHSLGDLQVAARRFTEFLDGVAEAAPGVPIDVVAHSQGGVVARLALAAAAQSGGGPPEVTTLVTLGSPHQGANLATAGAGIASTPAGAALLDFAGAFGLGVSSDSEALQQLSQLSPISAFGAGEGTHDGPDGLGDVGEGINFTSVAARGDPVVPSPRTRTFGANSVTVSVDGPLAHDALPGSEHATREIGLAVAGWGPTCRSVGARVTDVVVGHGIAGVHDAAGVSLLTLAALL